MAIVNWLAVNVYEFGARGMRFARVLSLAVVASDLQLAKFHVESVYELLKHIS